VPDVPGSEDDLLPTVDEVFTKARFERRQRVIEAITEFSWSNYGLDEVEQAAEAGREDPSCMAWAEDLADEVLGVLKAPPVIRT